MGTIVANSNHEDSAQHKGKAHVHSIKDVACASVNEKGRQAAEVSPQITYKMLKIPLPVHVFRNKKSLLIKLKSKNEKNIRNAKILIR
jgi:hypothetical protein